MNSYILLDAVTDIDDMYILSALKQLAHVENNAPKYRSGISFRKVLASVAVIVLLFTVSFTTALAVSPEFREMVFQFFHIEQKQVIPESSVTTEITPEDMFIEPAITLGSVIEAQYVHTPVAAHAKEGVFLICTDEVETNQGSHYDAYYESDGTFMRLEEHTFQQDYTIRGIDFHVKFDYVEHNNNVIITWVEANEPYIVRNAAGDASSLLFEFIFYDENYMESRYPVFLNLHTGELTDVLAGTGAEEFCIHNSAVSADKKKMLLARGTTEGENLYYVDLMTRQMYSVDSISGEHTDACSLISNTLVCWKLSGDYYTVWQIDLTTFQRTELFKDLFNALSTPETDAGIVFLMGFDDWIRQGGFYAGTCFAIEVDEQQRVYVMSLETGEKILIPDYKWTESTRMIPSPDGSKLLLAGGLPGENFTYVGVLDFEAMTFVEFSREHLGDIREHQAYWFEDNTIAIHAALTPQSLSSDFYLYSLEDNHSKTTIDNSSKQ